MATLASCQTANELEGRGWVHVELLSYTDDTPVPGLMLFTNPRQDLLMVLADGRVIDLLKVYHAAEDAVRNGFNGHDGLPAFVPDWPKMTRLADALNGEKL